MDYEKEETWLNEMSAKGLAFTGFSFSRYAFSNSKPGEYIYRAEVLEKPPRHSSSQKYLRFMADSGVECVESFGHRVYFRRRADMGRFDIYTDIDSRLRHYRRISKYWLFPAFIWMFTLILNALIATSYVLGWRDGETWFHLFLCILSMSILAVSFAKWRSARRKVKELEREKSMRG